MPYIAKELRQTYTPVIESSKIHLPGELNFAITQLLKKYVKDHGKNYTTYNDIVGVLECAKMEFVRRLVNPYEDQKIQENGDVYD